MKQLILALFLFSNVALANTKIVFKKEDRTIKSASIADFKKMAKAESLLVWEPHENKNISYEGYNLISVLDEVFGKSWKDYDLVLFTCADGYKDPIPRSLIESEKSLLAFERTDKKDFVVNNRFQNQKNIPLGPLYLVWNNLNNQQIRAEEASNWPYQVVGIELAHFASKFSHMIPPKDSTPGVQHGFAAFQKYCMTCHKVNGDGGDKGPELSTLIHALTIDFLKQWIDNPQKLQPGTTMPALHAQMKDRKQTIDDIISYLEAMKAKTH